MTKKNKAEIVGRKLGKGIKTFGNGVFSLAKVVDKAILDEKNNKPKKQTLVIRKLERDIKIAKLKNELKELKRRDDPWRF